VVKYPEFEAVAAERDRQERFPAPTEPSRRSPAVEQRLGHRVARLEAALSVTSGLFDNLRCYRGHFLQRTSGAVPSPATLSASAKISDRRSMLPADVCPTRDYSAFTSEAAHFEYVVSMKFDVTLITNHNVSDAHRERLLTSLPLTRRNSRAPASIDPSQN
jgi:hypothetical protein